MTLLDWRILRHRWFAGVPYEQQGFAGLPVVPAGGARYSAVSEPSSKAPALEADEVLFEIKDGVEYATLHADAFRIAMRQRDILQSEVGQLADEVERLRAKLNSRQ